jgi:ketosteroid isomerase-like protein
MNTQTQTRAETDVENVRKGFQAVGSGDLAGFVAGFHADATWNHRNPDRLGGVKEGIDAIVAFLVESMELTAGTLAPIPQNFLPDGAGHVAVVVRLGASRPDGRTLDDQQLVYFTMDGDLVLSVDQYVGDPPAVTDFWA